MTSTAAKVLIREDEIAARVAEMAEQISNDYADKGELVLIGVLKGAFIFLADLSRRLTIPRRVEFIAVSSYESGSQQSGAVRLVMDMRQSIEGQHVLIVEDIVDSGHTLHYLISMLGSRGPASIRSCTLVQKTGAAKVDVDVDYIGFKIPDDWVVGYGLDHAEQDRTLPYIGIFAGPR
ncbi:MAG TPA: hypoxanthine phosphoribosyltransferase [Woeseiaceae bacterium]